MTGLKQSTEFGAVKTTFRKHYCTLKIKVLSKDTFNILYERHWKATELRFCVFTRLIRYFLLNQHILLHSILSVLLSQQGTSTSFIQHFLLSCKRKPVSWTESTKTLSDIPELLQAYFKGQLKLWHVIYVWKRHMALPHETKTCPETTEVFSNALKAGLKHTLIFFFFFWKLLKYL